jgi:hypothetical protein
MRTTSEARMETVPARHAYTGGMRLRVVVTTMTVITAIRQRRMTALGLA